MAIWSYIGAGVVLLLIIVTIVWARKEINKNNGFRKK